ncbi:hypothetical protein CF326_g8769 [Tilletia indica]|nr:hypothetical protein CF326_g8769 [Tilletia indica]
MADPTSTRFLEWCASNNCHLSPKCTLTSIPNMGRGLIASQPIQEDELLFSVPRSILLNLHTSSLGRWCEANEDEASPRKWEKVRAEGWAPLILSLMWECWRSSAEGGAMWERTKEMGLKRPAGLAEEEEGSVKWGPYFEIMPTDFDSPMMWAEDEIKQLEGTDVMPRVGRAEADETYNTLIRPYILSHPTIFLGLPPTNDSAAQGEIEKYYSLAQFHLMGSRVLSRSFHVKDASKAEDGAANKKAEGEGNDDESDDEDDEDEDEPEDTADISMVPLADMLNARYASDNARLFFHPSHLEMRSTSHIPAGAQVFNTFGDPPNGDLLRRYGHVDEPNGADAVDLEAVLLGRAMCELTREKGANVDEKEMEERVKWLCDSEQAVLDDAFPLTYLPNFPPSPSAPFRTTSSDTSPQELVSTLEEALEEVGSLPEELVQCARVLCLAKEEFETQVKGKGKIPGPKLSAVHSRPDLGAQVELRASDLIVRALRIRLGIYPTSVEDDEEELSSMMDDGSQSQRRRRAALVVRLGEKRVLWDHVRAFEAVGALAGEKKKRKVEGTGGGGEGVSKKVRQ